MTVSSIEPVNNYAGNNSATRFDFDFFIENENELLVQHTNKAGYQTTLKLNTDYTINEIGSENGSYIIFPLESSEYTVLKDGEVITLSLNLKIIQEKEFKNSSKLSLKMLESALDYVTRLIQILNRKIERAVKVKEGINVIPDNLMENLDESVNKSMIYSSESEKSSKNAENSAILAKEWAVKENEKVEEIDFSSKYYANKAELSANKADEKAQEANEKYIKAIKDIQEECNEKINEIKSEAEEQCSRIQTLGFYLKDGNFYYINALGQETQLKFEKTDNLFDLIQKDHKLTSEDSEGLALLGTYVYKEAQDGRYGYSDFYEKCLEEYKSEENVTKNEYVLSNITGEIVNKKGILGGFSTKNYGVVNKEINFESEQSWEIIIKVKMPYSASNIAIIGSGEGSQKYGLSIRANTSNKIILYISGNATSWNIANAITSTQAFELGKEYLIRISYSLNNKAGAEDKTAKYTVDLTENITGEEKDWINYITKEIEVTTSTAISAYKVAQFTAYLGIDNNVVFTDGEIDLNESIIKTGGQIYWQGVERAAITENKNGHKFYNISDKEKIEKIYKDNGAAWYYGVDETKKRIFLPREAKRYLIKKKEPTENDKSWYNIYSDGWCEQGGMTSEAVAMGGSITVELAVEMKQGYSVMFNYSPLGNGDPNYWRPSARKIETTPTRFSINSSLQGENVLSKDEATYMVQGYIQAEEAVKNITYMVVGNVTRIKQAQTEAVEITTSENDTVPLFTGIYFDFKPNHASWLRAGYKADGNIYETVYNELVKCLESINNKYGIKIIQTKEMEAEKDYSEYWIVNQEEETFRTPLKTSILNTISKARILIDKKEPTDENPVWYNLYSDGWCEQGGHINTNRATTVFTVEFAKTFNDTNFYFNHSQYSYDDDYYQYVTNKTNKTVSIKGQNNSEGFDWIASGYTTPPTAQEIANNENIGLYFKVGNAVEKMELIDAGEVLEELNNAIKKSECKSYVIETYQNGNSGYKLWSDGYCEQWGSFQVGSGAVNNSVILLKPYKDSAYIISLGQGQPSTYESEYAASFNSKSPSGFNLHSDNNTPLCDWKTCGYIS